MNLIRKETPIPELYYTEHLWEEKEIKSVANITRRDVQEFLPYQVKQVRNEILKEKKENV